MSSSSIVSFMLLFLLLVFLLDMDEALGADQIEIRKLKETMIMRRNLEGNSLRSFKIDTSPSASKHCGGGRSFKKVATTERHDNDQFSPIPRGDSSSLCIRCVTTKRCVGVVGAPPSTYTCTTISTHCENIPGH
ncbi:hypothetical protein CARUB_v10010617mg [Capsella rubella]|uniref:Uncharacterized protein n=1 Tax=Capsella rubella TaxID=81985 RepID=R0I233_9BRAS|nr:uncharacterized protein LOC17897472 [Capsella rubella]EOA36309.1 hypothetical protein CARUB_v10010617mg [Capsella rubella]